MTFKTRGTVKNDGGRQLRMACQVIEHYHIEHTNDIVTRFKATGDGADIYVVRDPEWKARLEQCVESIFPPKVTQ